MSWLAAISGSRAPGASSFDVPSGEAPIFVRGLSRSGGTLLTTILDAHPDVAMSYELYPGLLAPERNGPGAERLAGLLGRRGALFRSRRPPLSRNVQTFVARCERSGVDRRTLAKLLRGFQAAGGDLREEAWRLRFVAAVCREKMRRVGKPAWGAKCLSTYSAYGGVWPEARFVFILRDGRDVLASQLALGSFGASPAEVAASWCRNVELFEEWAATARTATALVRYETLVAAPEAAVRGMCETIGLKFAPEMLRYYDADLTLYRSSHLSLEQVSRAPTDRQVGRWRRELTPAQQAEFEAVAGDTLARLGYGGQDAC